MASFTERLAYIISASGKDAVREFRSVRDSATKDLGATESRLGKFNANAAGLGAGLKGFGAGIIASIGFSAVDDLTQAASDLEQSAGAIDSVFGDAKVAIEDFGETAAQTAGLSKREVNEMASVVGSQLQGMGFSVDAAAEKTVLLEKRAADMAATFGGPTRQALEAISALFRGERDPIERYGVSIKDADVQARIAALGLDDSSIAAKKYATAVASLDLVLEGTAKTQGQFSREMNTAAGATARAAATYENAKADLGESLLPAKTALTNFAAREVEGATILARGVGKALSWLADTQHESADSADENAEAQESQANAMVAAARAAEEAAASVEDFKNATDDLADSAFGAKAAQDDVTESLLGLVDLAADSDRKRGDSSKRLADTIEKNNRRIKNAEESVADARKDAGKVNVPGAERDRANERLREAEERLAEVRQEAEDGEAAARQTKDEIDAWTPALDRATAAGLKNRGVLQDHVELTLDTAGKMLEEGKTAREINAYLLTQRDLLSDVANKVGFSRDAMREFLDVLTAAQKLVPNKPELPMVGGVSGPWSEQYARRRPSLPVIDGMAGPWSPTFVIQTGYVNDPQKLAEIISREVDKQLRRRG